MTIEEQSLRDLLASSYGEYCGHAIVECIQKGGELAITMSDGTVVVLTTIEDAKETLRRRFSWNLAPEE